MSVDARSLMCRNCMFADVHETSVGEVALNYIYMRRIASSNAEILTVPQVACNYCAWNEKKNKNKKITQKQRGRNVKLWKRQNCWMQEGNTNLYIYCPTLVSPILPIRRHTKLGHIPSLTAHQKPHTPRSYRSSCFAMKA